MSRELVPERTIKTCDFCLRKIAPDGPAQDVLKGRVATAQNVLDHLGHPAAENKKNFDVCDDCMPAVVDALNESATHLRLKYNESR